MADANTQTNLSDTALFVKSVLDPFYPKLEEKGLVEKANELVRKAQSAEIGKIESLEFSLACRETAREQIEALKNDKVNDAEQLDKMINVLYNFIEKLISNTTPPQSA